MTPRDLAALLAVGCVLITVEAAKIVVKNELVRGEACEPRYLRTLANAHMIDTAVSNYAVSSPILAKSNWSSISVNGEEVVIYTPACQVIRQPLETLSSEQMKLISAARSQLIDVRTGKPRSSAVRSVQYLVGGTVYTNNAQNLRIRESALMSIHDINGINYAASMAAFPAGLARVFRIKDVVAFVYSDKRVDMKPIACLESGEKRFFEQFELNLKEVEACLKRVLEQKLDITDEMDYLIAQMKKVVDIIRVMTAHLPSKADEFDNKVKRLAGQVAVLKAKGSELRTKAAQRENMTLRDKEELDKLSSAFEQNMRNLL